MGKPKITYEDSQSVTRLVTKVTASAEGIAPFTLDVTGISGGPYGFMTTYSPGAMASFVVERYPRHQLFKELRTQKPYRDEWDYWDCLAERGQLAWKVGMLSFCTRIAIESTLFFPFLEEEARAWLMHKFQEQEMLCPHFNERWDFYMSVAKDNTPCERDGAPFIYSRNGHVVHLSWATCWSSGDCCNVDESVFNGSAS